MHPLSKMKSSRKPPLAKSPMRLRSSSVLRPSNSCSLQTPPGSLAQSKKAIRCEGVQGSELRPEYRTISYELRALTQMVREEFGKENIENGRFGFADSWNVNLGVAFERGRFYDEYSARRNERLKRKKKATGDDHRVGKAGEHHLGVTVESAKKSGSKRKESLRKSASASYTAERCETPRYMLRSMTRANKKPPPPPSSLVVGVRKKIESSRIPRN